MYFYSFSNKNLYSPLQNMIKHIIVCLYNFGVELYRFLLEKYKNTSMIHHYFIYF